MSRTSTAEKFVEYVCSKSQRDKVFNSTMRNVDIDLKKFESWQYVIRWCHNDIDTEMPIFNLIGSSIVRMKCREDGSLNFGYALYLLSKDNFFIKSKIDMIIKCSNSVEVLRYIRILLRIIESKKMRICYSKLLTQLLYFDISSDIQKRIWVSDFYSKEIES